MQEVERSRDNDWQKTERTNVCLSRVLHHIAQDGCGVSGQAEEHLCFDFLVALLGSGGPVWLRLVLQQTLVLDQAYSGKQAEEVTYDFGVIVHGEFVDAGGFEGASEIDGSVALLYGHPAMTHIKAPFTHLDSYLETFFNVGLTNFPRKSLT
ncbi:hypothetical protein RvY_03363 [Ramazzottius varieornatus]|uniref:Uncharacterized protein n=1 Tax=Ramazzottius varieornatus TaxID=947166 RepID=A0A1D1UTJ7_RAMVA|nr:hypothetical protein RvY_03363 [Ramazzottius varieornatus]